MKKILCYCFTMVFTLSLSAQSDGYISFKQKVIDGGWIIEKEKKMYLSQGATDYGMYKLSAGRQYKIFCMSDDADVRDADVWLYDNSNNQLLTKDVENDQMAIVNFYAEHQINVKVLGKNIKSNSPSTDSRFYILVTYKR